MLHEQMEQNPFSFSRSDLDKKLGPLDINEADQLLESVSLTIAAVNQDEASMSIYEHIAKTLPYRVTFTDQLKMVEALNSDDEELQAAAHRVIGLRYLRSILATAEAVSDRVEKPIEDIFYAQLITFLADFGRYSPHLNLIAYINYDLIKAGKEAQVIDEREEATLFTDLETEPSFESSIDRVLDVEDYLQVLTGRQRQIIEAIFGFNGPAVNAIYSARMFGISEEYIRNVINQSLSKMKRLAIVKEQASTDGSSSDVELKYFTDPIILDNLEKIFANGWKVQKVGIMREGVILGTEYLGEMNVSILNLPPRILGTLIGSNLRTVGEIASLSDEELQKATNLGPYSLNELRQKLNFALQSVETLYRRSADLQAQAA